MVPKDRCYRPRRRQSRSKTASCATNTPAAAPVERRPVAPRTADSRAPALLRQVESMERATVRATQRHAGPTETPAARARVQSAAASAQRHEAELETKRPEAEGLEAVVAEEVSEEDFEAVCRLDCAPESDWESARANDRWEPTERCARTRHAGQIQAQPVMRPLWKGPLKKRWVGPHERRERRWERERTR